MNNIILVKRLANTSMLMLILAILPFPYVYYQFLRLVICGSAIFFAWNSHKINMGSWMWVMVSIALCFNPLFPFYLGRELWVLLDISTCVIFGVFLSKYTKLIKERNRIL
jgi:hypothetical protein